jgi:TonB family protein
MRAAVLLLALTLTPLFAQRVPIPGDTESSLEQGVEMFQSGRYQEAIAAFQKAAEFDPSDATALLYLGIAHTTQYIPGLQTPENTAHAKQANAAFLRVIEIAPANKTAFQYLASLCFREAQVLTDQEARIRKLDEARTWYQKLLLLDPQDKQGYQFVAMIDWMKCNPELMNARARLGMKPGDSGPLTDPALRQSLSVKYSPAIEDGIASLKKALEIDPQFEEAMTYMNLLIRARADLRDSTAAYQNDVKEAETWTQKAVETRNVRARFQGSPQRIRTAQPPSLITKVEPVYPPLARQARVQGTVRFTAIIGKDGRVQNLQLVSGPPLLVVAAQEAVKQWVYKPTLFNGEAVEVVTRVDVNFVLPAKEGKDRDHASAAAIGGKAK